MGIVYLISILALFITFVLIKKSDKELNIISFVSIVIVILLCYNAFICYVLTFFTIPVTLLNLSIVNVIVTVFMILGTNKNFGSLLKRKKENLQDKKRLIEMQKYKLDKFRGY